MTIVDSISAMPGPNAERGDLYNVHPEANISGDAHSGPRRMVCVAERPTEVVWTAMSRTTTMGNAEDLESPADADLGFTKAGWWSYRYLRSVKKRWTGHSSLCPFLTTLPEPMRTEVLNHYKNRPRPVVGA